MIDKKKYNLTPKQLLFCHEFLIDMNATKACIRAGYSTKTARIIATQNLAKLNIQEYISELSKNRFKECDLKAEMVIETCKEIAFSNILDFIEIDNNNSIKLKPAKDIKNTTAVCEMYHIKTKSYEKFKIKMHDKKNALRILLQYL